jgi:DNA replication protein DnaC
MRSRLIRLLGGEKPFREFTLDRYEVEPGNQFAYERCRDFSRATDNVYLYGACGVGKTHLAYAVARRCFEETLSAAILLAYQLARRVRMKEPDQEQAVINELVDTRVLVLDDLGGGSDTAFSRQILQEILDRREFNKRAGLLITSKYSLDELAAKLGDDSIPSRLAGMCQAIRITGPDRRVATNRSK